MTASSNRNPKPALYVTDARRRACQGSAIRNRHVPRFLKPQVADPPWRAPSLKPGAAAALCVLVLGLALSATPALGEVEIAALGSWGGAVNDVSVSGNVMAMNSGGRVLIVDISNPAAPVELSSLNLRSMATCVRLRGDYLYVSGDEHALCFRVYDISNPAAPVEVYAECGLPYAVLDMAWYGNVAYTLFNGDIRSWDMSDPAHAVKRDYVYGRADGLTVSGDYLYVTTDMAKFRVYNLLANRFKPPLLAEVTLPSPATAGGPIAIQGDYAYVAGHGYECDMAIVSISNPLAPVVVGTIPNTRTDPSYNSVISVSNGILYVVPFMSSAVKLYDVAGSPAAPVQIGTIATNAQVDGVRAMGTRAYVYDEDAGVIIVDCSNPAAPVRLGNVLSPAWMTKDCKVGNLLYVADKWNGFTILDVSDPRHIPMNPVGVYQSTGDGNWGIDVQDGLAYLGAGTGGLDIVDVSTPSAPVRVGHHPVPSGLTNFDDLKVRDGIAYVGASRQAGACATVLLTFDVSDPANIVLLDGVQVSGGCRVNELQIDVREAGIVLVHMANAAGSCGVYPSIVDASDPASVNVLNVSGPRMPTGLALNTSGRLRFVSSYDNCAHPASPGLYIHDVSNPASPVQVCYKPITPFGGTQPFQATSIAASGNDRVYIVAGPLSVLDVSNPSAPVVVAEGPNYYAAPDTSILAEGPLVYGVSGIEPIGVIIDLVSTRGDFDDDRDVDLADFAALQACFTGAGTPLPAEAPVMCRVFDFNADGDVDAADFAAFAGQMTGAQPPPAGPTGACCLPDGTCEGGVTAPDCTYALGGQYQGDGSTCDSVTCPPTGACCLPYGSTACVEWTQYACLDCGGTYHGDGTVCSEGWCPAGACCNPDDGSCTEKRPATCTANGGSYQGDGTTCATTACSWGRYSNTIDPMASVALAGTGLKLADDLTLAGTGARDLTYLDLRVYGNGGGAFNVTVELWTACPGSGGSVIPGTTFTWTAVPDDGYVHELVVDPLSPPVTIPDTVWMTATFSTPQSGWIIAEQAELGTTANVYARNNPWTCSATITGHYAGLWANLQCIEGESKRLPADEGQSQLRMERIEASGSPLAVEPQ
jgi:hypothetical protein